MGKKMHFLKNKWKKNKKKIKVKKSKNKSIQ